MKISHALLVSSLSLLPLSLIAQSDAPAAGNTSQPSSLSSDRPYGELEVVAELNGPIVTGITVSNTNRLFVSFPRWTDPVDFTVAEIVNGTPVPFPNREIHGQSKPPSERLVSVQSVVVDALDRLWMLDSGSINQGPVLPGGPKLLAVDLSTGQIVKKILFPKEVVKTNSYLNDVRFDLRRGQEGFAFITDSSPKEGDAIIVVNLATGESFRRLESNPTVLPEPGFLPTVEGRPLYVREKGSPPQHFLTGSDGIAIDNYGNRLFYTPLSSRRLYSVSIDALVNTALTGADIAKTITDEGDKSSATDGLEMDNQGRLYLTAVEHNAILRRNPNGIFEPLVHDPRLLWPDTLAISRDGYLYVTVNQLHRQPRFHNGVDERQKPWVIFRTKIGTGPTPALLAPPAKP